MLAALAHGKIHAGYAGVDAELGRFGHRTKHMGRFQKLFGWDAAAMQTGAAHFVALHHRAIEAGGCGVQRCGVAAGATTDDYEIKLLSRTDHLRGPSPTVRRP